MDNRVVEAVGGCQRSFAEDAAHQHQRGFGDVSDALELNSGDGRFIHVVISDSVCNDTRVPAAARPSRTSADPAPSRGDPTVPGVTGERVYCPDCEGWANGVGLRGRRFCTLCQKSVDHLPRRIAVVERFLIDGIAA